MEKNSIGGLFLFGIGIFAILAFTGTGKTVAHSSTQVQYSSSYQRTAAQAANYYGISPTLFVKQINQESGFNPNAVSSAGAIGIAQFMPDTAKGLGINPWDVNESLYGAAKLMSRYIARYGTYQMALAAYNAGPGRLNEALRNPNGWFAAMPLETQRYINDIMG